MTLSYLHHEGEKRFDPIGDWERKAIAEGRDPYAFLEEEQRLEREQECRFCGGACNPHYCTDGHKNDHVRRANVRITGEL